MLRIGGEGNGQGHSIRGDRWEWGNGQGHSIRGLGGLGEMGRGIR